MPAVAPVELSSVSFTWHAHASPHGAELDARATRRPPRVVVVSTYPPTKCGLASFTADVEAALTGAGADVRVVAVDTSGTERSESTRILATITKQDRDSYTSAARTVNEWKPDAVLVEHEFGIYGGRDGAFVLDFVEQMHVPVVATLHTVLSNPSEGQRAVLAGLAQRVAAFTVFTETAATMVRHQLGVGTFGNCSTTRGRSGLPSIEVIAHGAPVEVCSVPRGRVSLSALTALLGNASHLVDPDRFLLGTFGLLSPGKGLEQAIAAVGLLVASHPAVSLIIAGQTHPGIRDRSGETYRESLMQRCNERGVAAHVTFADGYLSVLEIAGILARADVFCTPYRDMDQVVSGALTFAMAAGCAVISTPYRYALDMLGDGAGTLVPVDDPGAMAAAIATFMDEPLRLLAAQRAASQFRALLSWPSVGASLLGAIGQMSSPSLASVGSLA